MNYKSILFFLGIYSLLVSIFSILNIFYSIYFDFAIGLNSYLITFFISSIIGLIFCYLGRNHSKNISLTDQIIFILLGFIPTILGHGILSYALKYYSTTVVISVPLGEPIIATILAYFIFNEQI